MQSKLATLGKGERGLARQCKQDESSFSLKLTVSKGGKLMSKDFAWELFKNTGNLDAFMIMRNIENSTQIRTR